MPDERPDCPICIKLGRQPAGKLIFMGPLLMCCGCQSAWTELEFLGDVKAAGLSYYFKGSLEGELVIYDPDIEQHKFIEEVKHATE